MSVYHESETFKMSNLQHNRKEKNKSHMLTALIYGLIKGSSHKGIFILKLVLMPLPVKLIYSVCISSKNLEIPTFTQQLLQFDALDSPTAPSLLTIY